LAVPRLLVPGVLLTEGFVPVGALVAREPPTPAAPNAPAPPPALPGVETPPLAAVPVADAPVPPPAPPALPPPPDPPPLLWANEADDISIAAITSASGFDGLDLVMENSFALSTRRRAACSGRERFDRSALDARVRQNKFMRKLIAFDDDTFAKLKQLGRDRMATLQDLADEAFAELLKKHGVPIDLKDALRKSAAPGKTRKSATAGKRPDASRSV
jgi:hypothetical protein